MLNIKTLSAAALISTLSFSAFAAEKITQADPTLEKIAVISVLHATTPDEVDQKLSEKAQALGATKYRILMTSSNDNTERGTAAIYR
jgi:multiple stress resistance protein BhsA